MPDTKEGRERSGRNKRRQLESRLYRRELETLDDDDELPEPRPTDADFLAPPAEEE